MDWINWEHPPPLLLPDPLQQDLFCPWRTSITKLMSGISEKGHVELRAVMWDLTSHNTLWDALAPALRIKDVRRIEGDTEKQQEA